MKSKLAIAIFLLLSSSIAGDEGMWTLDNFPRETVREKYGVDVTETWLNQLRLATTRLEGGLHGLLRVARRPRAHEPPLRAALPEPDIER